MLRPLPPLPSTSTEYRPLAVTGRGIGDETADAEFGLVGGKPVAAEEDGSSISISLAELGGREVNGFSEY